MLIGYYLARGCASKRGATECSTRTRHQFDSNSIPPDHRNGTLPTDHARCSIGYNLARCCASERGAMYRVQHAGYARLELARCINGASTAVTAMTAARRATTPGSRRVGRGAWVRAPSRSASASAASCSPCCGMCAAFASCLSWREALVDTCAMPEPCCPAIRPGRTPTYPSHLRRRVSIGCPAQDGEVSRALGCGPRTCTRLVCRVCGFRRCWACSATC